MTDLRVLDYYSRVRSVVDKSPAELTKALPELRGLEPAQSQDPLDQILHRVGENVATFFRNFPNVSAVERIREVRLGFSEEVFDQKFNYLALTRADSSRVSLAEYRTDGRGARVEPRTMARGSSVITSGFASMPVHLHPSNQPASRFRYLGRQAMGGRETYVVAFAQRPESAGPMGVVRSPEGSAMTLVQGVAWIDELSFQIVRLRTGLLAPPPGAGLKQQTTDIRFEEVRFEKLPAGLWLPHEVVVTMDWKGEIFRNRHRYSDFKLFSVETKQEQKSGALAPESPRY